MTRNRASGVLAIGLMVMTLALLRGGPSSGVANAGPASPKISFANASSSGIEPDIGVTLLVTLSDAATTAVSADVNITGGTATTTTDYDLNTNKVTFTPGDKTDDVSITVINDTSIEPDETIVVTISNPSNATLGATPSHTYTIGNDDQAPRQCRGEFATVLGTTGTDGDDVIVGTEGDDVIDGLGGNDTICARAGNDVVLSGAGNDIVLAGTGDDSVVGVEGNDELFGGPGVNTLSGGVHDTLVGGPDDDTLTGGAGVDTARGGGGADTLNGRTGPDTLRGQGGDDTLRGGGDDDTLFGGPGADDLFGQSGDDGLQGGLGSPDACDGGIGADTLVAPGGCESRVSVR